MSRFQTVATAAFLLIAGLFVLLAASALADVDGNDDYTNAESVTPGTHSGTLDIISDMKDYYKFSASPGCLIRVDLKVTTAENISCTLDPVIGPADLVRAKGGANATIDYISKDSVNPPSWFIIVQHTGDVDGSYEFTFTVGTQDDAGSGRDAGETTDRAIEVPFDTTVASLAGNRDTVDIYSFRTGGGKVVRVEFNSDADENQTLHFIDSSMDFKWSILSRSGESNSSEFMTSTGTSIDWFYLRIESPWTTRGSYELNVTLRDQMDAGQMGDAGDDKSNAMAIEPGTHTGEMGDLDEHDYYRITVSNGMIIGIEFTSDATPYVQRLELRDPLDYRRGATLECMEGGANVSLEVITAREAGVEIWYIGLESIRTKGHYSFTLDLTPQDDGGSGTDAGASHYTAVELALDTPTNGTIGYLDDLDVFKVQAGAGDVLHLWLTLTPRGDRISITLEDESSNVFARESADLGDTVHLIVPTENETAVQWYYLVLGGLLELSEYDIEFNVERQADGGEDGDAPDNTGNARTFPASGNAPGQLGGFDDKDVYTIAFESGDVINVSLVSESGYTIEVHVSIGDDELLGMGSSDNATAWGDVITADETPGGVAHVVVLHKIYAPAGVLVSYQLNITVDGQSDAGTGQDAPGSHADAIPVQAGTHTCVLGGLDEADMFTVTMSPLVPLVINLTSGARGALSVEVTSAPFERIGETLTSEGPTASSTFTAPPTMEPGTIWYIRVGGAPWAGGWSGGEYGLEVALLSPVVDTSPPTMTMFEAMGYAPSVPLEIMVEFEDDMGIVDARLYHRAPGGTDFLYVELGGEMHIQTFTVPGQYITSQGIEYYVWVTDGTNEVTFPSAGASGPDILPPANERPTIEHTAPGDYREDKAVPLTAIVTSAAGVRSVKLYYRMQGEETYNVLSMEKSNGDYAASVPSDHVSKGTLEYYIVATNEIGFDGNNGTAQEPLTLEVKAKKAKKTPGLGGALAVAALVVSLGVTSRRRP